MPRRSNEPARKARSTAAGIVEAPGIETVVARQEDGCYSAAEIRTTTPAGPMNRRAFESGNPGQRWRRRELNPGPQASGQPSFTCVAALPQATGFVVSASDLSPESLGLAVGSTDEDPALVMTPFRYQNYLTVGRLHGFLGRESECVVVRN